ncbi:plexin-C1-like [Neoarius graeffei]|uniref:plexin-C1-like n=1 Tax=Neoarius graeffei TaxID=443677 RepID=UPI00298D56C7|nr:plexin-C1-like [Neoarius graeffei]XP_060770238.1 plexin-C1-like [Neoarius graeffei]
MDIHGSYTTRTVLFGLFILLKGAVCTSGYTFNGVIRHFAVGNDKVFVATDSRLYQMKHDLVQEKIKDIKRLNSRHQNAVSILLPFEKNASVIICGNSDCGYCEVLDITDITRTIYREEDMPVGQLINESSVAFIVDVPKSDNLAYILVGSKDKDKDGVEHECLVFNNGVTLLNTHQSQRGGIFSQLDSTAVEANIKIPDVEWVDGFQVPSQFQSYLFANTGWRSSSPNKVVLFKMDNNNKKSEMTESLKVATLSCCEGQAPSKLVSSTFILFESSLLWMGIFRAEQPHNPENNTALAIYNITGIKLEDPPQEITCNPSCGSQKDNGKPAVPLAVVFKHNSMTSVAARRKGSWTALFIGTANGQLIKLVLDRNYRPGCVQVLYRSDDDRMVFPRMHFDPLDHNYIYIALRNQINRIAVTQCDKYKTLRDCISSMDPFCGWCGINNRCCIQEECPGSPWISISKDGFQKELVFFQVVSVTPGEINLNLHLYLDATESLPLTCTFQAGNVVLCNMSSPVPKCSCNFSEKRLSSDGLPINVRVNISSQTFIETLTVRNCPKITENVKSDAQCTACVSAGCYWNSSSRNCTWIPVSAMNESIQDICSESSSEGNYTPEILSLQPNEVSFHGKNNAEIKGKNLELVKRIRFQGYMECASKEKSVLERSADTLKFRIPDGNKGTAKVCVVTEDGRCHSSAIVTYYSLPTCTELQPGVTWSSGERKIHVSGSNLKFVDAVEIHTSSSEIFHSQDNKTFWFHAPNQRKFSDAGPSTVSLRVVNSTVVCPVNLIYQPDPEFTSFTASEVGNDMLVIIQKTEDLLNLTKADLNVWVSQDQKRFECIIEVVEPTVVICKISGAQDNKIKVDSLKIEFGKGPRIELRAGSGMRYQYLTLVTLIILILLGAVAGVFIHRKSQQRMNTQMNKHPETLENEIRMESRQALTVTSPTTSTGQE